MPRLGRCLSVLRRVEMRLRRGSLSNECALHARQGSRMALLMAMHFVNQAQTGWHALVAAKAQGTHEEECVPP